jgi:hypothetical protein
MEEGVVAGDVCLNYDFFDFFDCYDFCLRLRRKSLNQMNFKNHRSDNWSGL